MTPKQLQQLIEDVRHTVSVASLNYDIWWVYVSKETRPKYLKTLNTYPLFFQASIHAHFVALLVALYRLYETRRDTNNIPNFIRELSKSALIPKVALDQIQVKYDLAKPLWQKVSVLRNEAFGHRASEQSIASAFKKAGITPNNLRDLVKCTKELINEATHALDRTVHSFNLSATRDTLSMLEDLRTRWVEH